MSTIPRTSRIPYATSNAQVRRVSAWLAMTAAVVAASVGCKTTEFFTRKHYSKPTVDSVATALAAVRESTDPAQRRAAFEYLGNPGHVGADRRDEISSILGLALGSEPNPQSRIVILQSLARLESPKRWESINEAFTDKDANVRATACRIAGRAGHKDHAKVLDELLTSDPNLDVRLAAADSLGQIPSRDAAMALLTGVEDSDVAVRYRCQQSLKNMTGKDHAGNVAEWRDEIKTANFEEIAAHRHHFGLMW